MNSGTSADGVDAVACEVRGRGLAMRVRVLGHVQRSYEPALRRRLLAAMAPAETTTEEICRLGSEVGAAFASTAEAAVRELGLRRIDLIGSHGQTVCHLPPRTTTHRRRGRHGADRIGATLQIGQAAIIAARLRVPVVADFRQADMAVGGQGAPLVPWTDYVLLRHRTRSRVIQNLGGIANLTWLPAGGGPDDVLAFDTGPGNMMIDGLVRHFSGGCEHFDRGGHRAARGKVHERILERLMTHRFLAEPPPKSCGREEFGETWLRRLMARYGRQRISPGDWIATATAFTAVSIARSYARFLPRRRGMKYPVDEIVVCGGGAENPTLLRMIGEYVAREFDVGEREVNLSTMSSHGISPQAKEGLSFAMLAAACVDGVPANLPQVTGASRRIVLGQVCCSEPHR